MPDLAADRKSSVLRTATLGDLRTLQHVAILKDTASVGDCLKTLAAHRVVSAPVVVATKEDDHPGPVWNFKKAPEDVLGFIDIKDVIRSFLEDVKGTGILEYPSMLKKMRALEEKGTAFSHKTMKDLRLTGGDGCFLHVGQQAVNLLELAHGYLLNPSRCGAQASEGKSAIHRIAIFDSSGRIINIISQSDIVRYLLVNVDKMSDVASQTITELGMATKQLITVPPEKSAVEALKIMEDNNVGAVAVVNSEGQIVGTFSATDMRTITPEHFGSLALPVGEFLALEHGTEYSGYTIASENAVCATGAHAFARDREGRVALPGAEVGQSLVVCGPLTTLKAVMSLLTRNRVHRTFIVDENMKPLSVISCTDILRKLCQIEQ